MNILDISSDLMEYNNLIGDTSSLSKTVGIVAIVLLISVIVFVPLFMFLKYLMDIKVVKKGTLQALHEFYNTQQVNNNPQNNNISNPENIATNTNNNQTQL